MGQPAPRAVTSDIAPGEQRFTLYGITWEQYEAMRAATDHISGLRMTYLEGALELMSPGTDHEWVKKCLARLLEIYALERRIPLNGYGGATFRKRTKERGLEPDECYVLGPMARGVPDIAIEVVFSHGTIDKLEVYRGLDVPEVWIWEEGALTIWQLSGDGYHVAERSRFLPELDLALLLGFVRPDDQTAAVGEYRDALRG